MSQAQRMTLYMFSSEKSEGLNAFAATVSGATLPEKFAPWIRTGKVLPDRSPPHGLNRQAIEQGIAKAGYQLWRRREKPPEAGAEPVKKAVKKKAPAPAAVAEAAPKPTEA